MAGFLLQEVAVVVLLPIGLVAVRLLQVRAFLVAFFQILSIFAKWRTEN